MTDDLIQNDGEEIDPSLIEALEDEDEVIVPAVVDPEEDHESLDEKMDEELEEDEELDEYDDKDKF
jgi:hypothetical protein